MKKIFKKEITNTTNCLKYLYFSALSISIGLTLVLSGCSGTAPKLGGASGMAVTGASGGASSEGANSQLESCTEPLGTILIDEDRDASWWDYYYRNYPQLGSTTPVLRMMVQQSNCFVVVERGRSMNNLMEERALQESGEMRSGSNFGKGQIVAADYTMSPSIQFSESGTSGVGTAVGGLFGPAGRALGALAGGLKSNEAATTLLLIDNRSTVQISSAVGSAKNFDFKFLGGGFGGGIAGASGGFTKTPEGKVLIASFADSYNQMVKALRNYRAQNVAGGLGKGGTLKVGN